MTFKQVNEIPRHEEIKYLAVQTVTANGHSRSAPLKVDYGSVLVFFVDVTAKSGTAPTLDVFVDIQDPVSGKWVNQDEFDTITGVDTYALAIFVRSTKYALRWVLGGTNPSFTFSVSAVIIK